MACFSEHLTEEREQRTGTSKRPAAAHRAARDISRQFQVRWRSVTVIRFAFVTLQHDHDAKTFGLLLKDLRSRRQEFAEECDNNGLMA